MGIVLPVHAGYSTPCTCWVCTPLGMHHPVHLRVHHHPAHLCRTDAAVNGEGRPAALTRGVTERTVRDALLTVTRFTVGHASLRHPFHCWATLLSIPRVYRGERATLRRRLSLRPSDRCGITRRRVVTVLDSLCRKVWIRRV